MLATSHNFQTPEVFQTRINDFLSLQSIRFHSNFYSTKFKFFLFVNIQKKKKKKKQSANEWERNFIPPILQLEYLAFGHSLNGNGASAK